MVESFTVTSDQISEDLGYISIEPEAYGFDEDVFMFL